MLGAASANQRPALPDIDQSEAASPLSEVQALPALILDTSLETAGDPDSLTNDDSEETEACDNEDIVWRTSQYYGIDLVKFS